MSTMSPKSSIFGLIELYAMKQLKINSPEQTGIMRQTMPNFFAEVNGSKICLHQETPHVPHHSHSVPTDINSRVFLSPAMPHSCNQTTTTCVVDQKTWKKTECHLLTEINKTVIGRSRLRSQCCYMGRYFHNTSFSCRYICKDIICKLDIMNMKHVHCGLVA